ncbi:MAG: glycogen debranching enzyme N-terminal domain-containing protein [Planctomycetota bacterium]|nr:glycogen debranching enzyme N-terminal domain-containing protein [Planctomycetota bacterium]
MNQYQLTADPVCGTGQVLFAGEVLKVGLRVEGAALPANAKAFLRTDLNASAEKRRQVIERVEEGASLFAVGWHDVEMNRVGENSFSVELIGYQPGYYEFKTYLAADGVTHWPWGDNSYVSVHALKWWGNNSIYSAFPRQFGPYKEMEEATPAYQQDAVNDLEEKGFIVIPPSATLDDLQKELPFLFEELGIRILHLLPVQETPTHYARMGRYGSPYAAADMRSVNHAYCAFRTDRTPNEHFRQFCAQVHAYGGEVLLDMAVNHLGWSTELLNDHPDWFVRRPDGNFVSPGAWGVTWEDLVELDFSQKEVWKYLADSLLLWCERGVDGFRADAGYQVPVDVWEYVTARVLDVFPDTLFLLEGLGGPWKTSEAILRRGGMQWAYSEMFQQQGTEMLYGYLRHLDRVSNEVGILANYAETHDNNRLALGGREFVKHRLVLCALTSSAGSFGFTNGVEWLATEKISVHESSGLRWGNPDNIVEFIRDLNSLLKTHPLFRGQARVIPVGGMPADVLAFERKKEDEHLFVVMNLHPSESRTIEIPSEIELQEAQCILTHRRVDAFAPIVLQPLETLCIDLKRPLYTVSSNQLQEENEAREEETRLCSILGELWGELFDLDGFDKLVNVVREKGLKVLIAASTLGAPKNADALAQRILEITEADIFLGVSEWNSSHGTRLHVLSTGQVLFLEQSVPFRTRLVFESGALEIPTFKDFGRESYVAYAQVFEGGFIIEQSRLDRPPTGEGKPQWLASHGHALCLAPRAQPISLDFKRQEIEDSHRYLLTNDRGSYALQPLSPHTIYSKYDALFAANLHPEVPDERCVLIKRIRIYLTTPMFTYPLDLEYLVEFRRWPWPTWFYEFRLQEGDIRVQEQVQFSSTQNAGRITLTWDGPSLADHAFLVRPDLEFRGHHGETRAFGLDERQFAGAYRELDFNRGVGFRREITDKLEFMIQSNCPEFRPEGEWQYGIRHPHEGTRGQTDSGDAYSPGYFHMPLNIRRSSMHLDFGVWPVGDGRRAVSLLKETESGKPKLLQHLAQRAAKQFLVKRGELKTVLAGYPWFLDWGRDTFIAARGYLASGYTEEVRDLVFAFAALERDGTLPNALAAKNDNDRDTSDAPLWFLKVIEELSDQIGWLTLASEAEQRGLNLAARVTSICDHYMAGTPNGIKCDTASGLVYSPPHFTWMDTNYPACTPRVGYPIEIQALWIRGLEFAHSVMQNEIYKEVALRARQSIQDLFWMEEKGYYADCLPARSSTPPSHSSKDESLRPNQLYAVTFGITGQDAGRRTVINAWRHLLIPSGLRSVADLPLSAWPWLEGADVPNGVDPMHPFKGRYEGDEDTARKPAYHNGTGWGHLLPVWVEALVVAFEKDQRAIRLGRAILRTYESEMRKACVGQISEVFDGDYPHKNRGCCAQAWAVTEFLRVWKMLEE